MRYLPLHLSNRDAETMARFLLTAAGLAAASFLTACSFDYPIEGKDGLRFGCFTDDDCVAGFLCVTDPGAEIGVCLSARIDDTTECQDRDGDGFFAAPCSTVSPDAIDCDDTNPNVSPQAREVCNGIDDNCNGVIDEGIAPLPCPLQLGVCAGARRQCVDGAFQDCINDGLYGPTFEVDEVSCDGLDNDCNGSVDPNPPCACDPTLNEATECGTDTGACTRGIRLCNNDFSLTACVEARIGRVCAGDGSPCTSNASCTDGTQCIRETCEANDDCGSGGYCVLESVRPVEDPFDDCQPSTAGTGPNASCARRVCRYLEDDLPCTSDDECGEGEFCIREFCQRPNVTPATETCNGIDDSCNGLIDNDSQRRLVCGLSGCPFNTVLIQVVGSTFMCVDRYEASRPDATEDFPGEVELYTIPRPGVVPWTGITSEDAAQVCSGIRLREATGTASPPVAVKQLCRSDWYDIACGGPKNTGQEREFPYAPLGEEFVAGACVDSSLGLESPAVTGGTPECCYAPNPTPGFADVLTCDMVGNVAEWVRTSRPIPELAGGSFRSPAEAENLRCGALAAAPENIVGESHIGFRCCTPQAQ